MNGALVPTEIVSKGVYGYAPDFHKLINGVGRQHGPETLGQHLHGLHTKIHSANSRAERAEADTARAKKRGKRAAIASGAGGAGAAYGWDRLSGGSDRRKAFRQAMKTPEWDKSFQAAWNADNPKSAARHGLALDRLTDRQVAVNNRAKRQESASTIAAMSKGAAGRLVRQAKMAQHAGKIARRGEPTRTQRAVTGVRRATLTDQPGGPAAFSAGALAAMAFAPGRSGTEHRKLQAGNGLSKAAGDYLEGLHELRRIGATAETRAAGGMKPPTAPPSMPKRGRLTRRNVLIAGGAGTAGGAEAMRRRNVSKDWALPIPHPSTYQARNQLGQFASHENDFTHSTGTNLTSRRTQLVEVEGRGRGGLAPAMTRRSAARPANSNSPNGAGYGRRLP